MKEMSRVVFAYILWAVSVVLSALIALTARDVIFNGFVLGAASNAGKNQSADFYLGQQLRALEPWLYIISGIALIVVIASLEHYFREGAHQKKLTSRFLKVTAIEIGVLAAVQITRFIFDFSLGKTSWNLDVLVLVEVAAIGLGIWVYRRKFFSRQLA